MSTFGGPEAPEKLCLACFSERFPGQPVGTLTWARECTQCHKPTPSLSTLVKVNREAARSE